jgi:hypothetical protein
MSSGLRLLLSLGVLARASAQAAPSCNSSLLPGTNLLGSDLASLPSSSASSCRAACCSQPGCAAFTFTTSQPHASGSCAQGSACCWLKAAAGASAAKPNCTSGVLGQGQPFARPQLTRLATVAADPAGHLRDPSPVVQDASGTWHFWVDFIPLSQGTDAGWHAFLHHYSAPALLGPWSSHGLSEGLNWSSSPSAWDSGGMLSSSAVFSEAEGMWFIFYTGTSLANYSSTLSSAQLVATAPSPYGPWTKRGTVCQPSGGPPEWAPQWNARRCDSGRALEVGGLKGFWTKGVRGSGYAQEGLFFPEDPGSFLPPYREWPGSPVYNASSNPQSALDGYENCEAFRGPPWELGGPWLHWICQNHAGGGSSQPHFVSQGPGLSWAWLGNVDTAPALEPTPVYSGMPGDAADVEHFIARVEDGSLLHIDLYSLAWEQ